MGVEHTETLEAMSYLESLQRTGRLSAESVNLWCLKYRSAHSGKSTHPPTKVSNWPLYMNHKGGTSKLNIFIEERFRSESIRLVQSIHPCSTAPTVLPYLLSQGRYAEAESLYSQRLKPENAHLGRNTHPRSSVSTVLAYFTISRAGMPKQSRRTPVGLLKPKSAHLGESNPERSKVSTILLCSTNPMAGMPKQSR